MSYCKYCGKELQEGGVCGCPQSEAAAAAKAALPADTSGTAVVKERKIGKKWYVLGGAVLIALIVFLVIYIINHVGARGAAVKYAKNLYDSKGGKTYYSMVLPDDLCDSLEGDKLDAMIDEFNDENKETLDDYKVKYKKISKVTKLDSRGLNGAERYFAQNAANYDKSYRNKSFDAEKGYVYKITYKIKDRQSGETKNYSKEIAVIKFSGEGWKVLDKELGDDQSFEEYLNKLDVGNKTAEKFGF